ncbi:retinol dehydrogenase 8 [Corynespora cassiicola Philippines]|uniref:Retinol dehydrogenase 8 n=1 Tax=Corynespora cassiicola Philippines TaxID=1448308 RepID=A0A2T2NX73_CORCC|nr:retinol dehydrogenase 8 [Corynespora cassiicola Philippines]
MPAYSLPENAVWFITGCSSGIGLALATHLLTKPSIRVVATARDPSTLSALPPSPRLLTIPLDVTSPASIESALSSAIEAFSRIDVLVNNAGYAITADTETAPPPAARGILETNFWGAAHLSQRILPIFRDQNPESGQRGGLVLQITSLGGRHGFPGNAFYHASKFALEGFSESVAKEMHPEWNVHFCCVEPGGVKTRWAETALGGGVGLESGDRHPAYRDPDMPINQMLRYKKNPEAMKHWADTGLVVRGLWEVVSGGHVPFRLPLGADSWGMQKRGHELELERLDRVKGVAVGVSGDGAEEQLKSIEFLEL